jgi:hypothetical protein
MRVHVTCCAITHLCWKYSNKSWTVCSDRVHVSSKRIVYNFIQPIIIDIRLLQKQIQCYDTTCVIVFLTCSSYWENNRLIFLCRSEWSRGPRSWVRIPFKAWVSILCAFILCLYCSVCRQSHCYGLIPRPRGPTDCLSCHTFTPVAFNPWEADDLSFMSIYPCNRLWRPTGCERSRIPHFSTQSAHRWRWGCQPYLPAALYPQEGSWYSFLLQPEWPQSHSAAGSIRLIDKIPMTSSGIEPATFQLVA